MAKSGCAPLLPDALCTLTESNETRIGKELDHMSARITPVVLWTLAAFALFGSITNTGPAAFAQEAIIIDHNCTDLDAIPAYWLEQAKNLTFHYAHTSHGSQVVSGVLNLESLHAEYSIAVRQSSSEGLPAEETPPALRMYDGNPPETYIEPGDYWDGETGKNRTRMVAATGNYDFSMWSWCGQQSSNSEATTRRYLDTMADFEDEFPEMRFILMTGHTDGSYETGNLNLRNQQVRDFATSNGMVLFDFADIESYNPDGVGFLELGCEDDADYDGGNWASEWCTANPGHELCDSCSCAHSTSIVCNLKGRAFWWMMARLAGWSGLGHGDGDGDGDVDIDDFTLFADCFAGPQTMPTPSQTTVENCQNSYDGDHDEDIDLDDFRTFQGVFTGS